MSGIVRVCSLLAATALLAGCMMTTGGPVITGSGRPVTQEYDFRDFTRVKVSNAFRVTIDRGERYAVAVSVDDNLADYLDVRLEGDTLYIGMTPSLHLGFRNTTQRAEITMPSIEGIGLSGATQGELSGFSSNARMEIEVSGASRLRGDITVGDTRIEISGASTVEIAGSATDLDIEVSGASNAKLGEFESGETRTEASGASHVTVRPSGRLTGAASGASTVTYLGNPESVQVDTSGASNVRRGQHRPGIRTVARTTHPERSDRRERSRRVLGRRACLELLSIGNRISHSSSMLVHLPACCEPDRMSSSIHLPEAQSTHTLRKEHDAIHFESCPQAPCD